MAKIHLWSWQGFLIHYDRDQFNQKIMDLITVYGTSLELRYDVFAMIVILPQLD